jgi:hypothetical protein
MPGASISDYCDQGCILGIAPQAELIEIGSRVAMIVDFGMKSEGGTLAQELAHAMGRMHADCGGPQFVDPDYPYGRGTLGVPGWDLFDKSIIDPDGRYHDFMSYCGPVWTSDYTWAGIFERMEDVAKQMEHKGPNIGDLPSDAFGVQAIHFDGKTLTMGEPLEVAGSVKPTTGVNVRWENAAGVSLGSAPAAFRKYDNIPGGIVIAPTPPAGATVTRVEGVAPRALALRDPTSRWQSAILPIAAH